MLIVVPLGAERGLLTSEIMAAIARPAIPRPAFAQSTLPPRPVMESCAEIADDDIVGVDAAPPRRSSAPPPPPSRVVVKDPSAIIHEGLYNLAFAKSASEAAEMCASTLARALGARAVIIHRHDDASHELRAIAAQGAGDFDIIGTAEPSDDDLIASAVICNETPLTVRFDGALPRMAPKRLHHVGAPRSVVAAPAMSWGRCLAVVEVIDADPRHEAQAAASAAYVAEQLAQYLLGAS